MDAKWTTKSDFQRSISQGVTLIDFDAPWCQPCREQAPIIATLERDFKGTAQIKTVNIDDHQEIALNLGIQSIPTIIIYKNGQEIDRFVGLQSTETLDGALRTALDAAAMGAMGPH